MNHLKSISGKLTYDHIVGTGGIGSGIFFSLEGNDTLGREESRMASLLPYRDYCKLHIILHYISVLLGENCRCLPIGCVGEDEAGKNLLVEMQSAGIKTDHVKKSKEFPTLFSVCYQYPNREGGNITTAASASNSVLIDDIDSFFLNTKVANSNEIILAVPEVPVRTRIRLLQHGRERNSLNVSAVSSSEVEMFEELGGVELSDLLFINQDEAEKFARTANHIIPEAIQRICSKNPSITLFITAGAKGVYCYFDGQTEFLPVISVQVKSTAGAGDAFLAGTLCGICCGLKAFEAAKLGVLVAAASVTSQDTINHNINADFLYDFIEVGNLSPGTGFMKIFNR